VTLDGWALDEEAPARVTLPSASARSRAPMVRIAAALVLLAAGAWALHDVAWTALWRALTSARPEWIAAAAAVNLGAVALQAARWQALVRPLSRAATFGAAFQSLTMGFALSMVVPARAGELARMQSFSRRTGLPQPSVLGSIVLDHLVNAAGLLLGLGLLPLFLDVPSWIRPGAVVVLALFAIGAALVLALATVGGDASRLPLPVGRIAGLVSRVRRGVVASTQPGALGASFGASLASWALEIQVTALAMKAVGLELPYSAALLVLLAVNLSLAVPFAPPGNVGTVELGATLALLGFGVAKEQALAFAIVYHVLQIVPVGILGIVFASRRLDVPDPA